MELPYPLGFNPNTDLNFKERLYNLLHHSIWIMILISYIVIKV